MDRRLAFLLAALLLPGCFGSSDTTKPTAEAEKPPVRVAKSAEKEPAPEKPVDVLDGFDPSKFSLGDGDPTKMPKEETPSEPVKPAEKTPPAALAKSKLPPLVVPGVPEPPQPFAGDEIDEETPIPEEVQRLLNSYDEDNFDAVVKLLLTYPQAKVRREACTDLNDLDSTRGAETLLIMRAALGDPDPTVRAAAASNIRSGLEYRGWKSQDALGELIPLLGEEGTGYHVLITLQQLGADAAPAVPYLAESLSDPNADNRVDIATTLGMIGDAAKPTIPQIVKMVEETKSSYAGRALGKLGAEKELQRMLTNSDYDIREAAYEGIGELEAASSKTVKAVLQGSSDQKEWFERSTAAEALGRIRPTTPEIVDALVKLSNDKQELVRLSAYKSMGTLDPPSDRVIPILVAALDKEGEFQQYGIKQALSNAQGSPEVRLLSLIQLAIKQDGETFLTFSAGGEEFYPLLQQIAADETKPINERAIALIGLPELRGKLGRDVDDVKDEICQFARQYAGADQPAELRGAVGIVLDECGESDDATNELLLAAITGDSLVGIKKKAISDLCWQEYAPALPIFAKILKARDERLTPAVLSGIDNFGEAAAEVVPAIVNLELDPKGDDYDQLVSAQVGALGLIGAHAELSQPLLEKMLAQSKSDDYNYEAILLAWSRVIAANDLDATKVLPSIVRLLKNGEDSYDRSQAFDMLTALGPKAATTTSLVVSYLTSEDEDDWDNAAATLESFGPEAKEAGPALAEAAGRWKDPWRALNALIAIKSGGPQFAAIAPKLLKDIDQRGRVLETLAAIGPEAGGAAGAVAEILDSPDEWERQQAVEALGALKQASQPALPKLKDLAIHDSDWNVRQAALKALMEIAPDDPSVAEVSFAQLETDDREAVAAFMKNLGDKAQPYLTERIASDSPQVRKTALKLLSQMSLPSAETQPLFEKLMADEDPQVKAAAAGGLLKLGQRTPEVAAALVAGLSGDDSEWEVRSAIYHCRRQATPALVQLILDPKKSLEARAGAIDLLPDTLVARRNPAFQPLFDALQGEQEEEQIWGAMALAQLEDRSPEILAKLIAASRETGPLQEIAIRRLSGFASYGDAMHMAAQKALLELLASDNEETVQLGVDALQYNALAPETIAELTRFLTQESTQIHAALVLGTITAPCRYNAAALQGLATVLTNEDEEVRQSAARALLNGGPAGAAALVEVIVKKDDNLDDEDRQKFLLTICERDLNSNQSVDWDESTIAKLATLASGDQPKLATAAALVLAGTDSPDLKLGPALLNGFNEDDYRLRDYTSRALQSRESDADFLVPQLIERMSTADEELQSFLCAPLAKLGKDSPEAEAALMNAILTQEDRYEQQQLARELGESMIAKIGAEIAKADDPQRQSLALWAYFGAIRESDEVKLPMTVPDGVRAATLSEDPQVRLPAALILTLFDPEAKEAVEPLVAQLESEDSHWDAVQALRRLGATAAPAVPRLLRLMENPEESGDVIQVLGSIGPAAAPAVAQLAKLISDENYRYEAIEALKQIGPTAKEAGPTLDAELRSAQDLYLVASAIIAIGAPTDALVAEFKRRLADPYDKYDAIRSIDAIAEITPIAPILIDALNSDDVELQAAAAYEVSQLKNQDPGYLAPLLARVESDVPEVAAAAIRAAAKQPNSAEKMLPILEQKLKVDNGPVLLSAITAIGEYKEAAKSLTPALLALLPDDSIQDQVVHTLGEFGPAAAAAVPQLQKLLDEDSTLKSSSWRQGRWAVIQTLGDIGPASKPCLPKLLDRYSQAKQEWEKETLGAAIWKIDPSAAQQAGIEPPKQEKSDQ